MTRSAQYARSHRSLLAAVAVAAIALPTDTAEGGVISIPFSTANFSDPLDIDNPYFPLEPGTVKVFRAEGVDGCEEVVVTVKQGHESIEIGVDARIVEDLAYEDEDCDGPLPLVLVEKTDDWFGQDNDGNVWYFGEHSEDCEPDGSCTLSSGSWEAGVDGALPGIIMLASPTKGDQYYQEFYEGFAEDQARVVGTGITVELTRDDAMEPGTWTNCLKTKEWNQLETGFNEQKYYCPEVGEVAVDEHHGKELRFEWVDPDADASDADAFQFRTVPNKN
jgi:hypothetical protein